jgi:hypothetical protein
MAGLDGKPFSPAKRETNLMKIRMKVAMRMKTR